MVGKIERVQLRNIWKHEAYDFTTWLEENIDVLNDAMVQLEKAFKPYISKLKI